MIVFMNEYYTKVTSISGVPYYMIEMVQFLKDKHNIQDIKELVNPDTAINRKIVHDRYTYTFDTITSLDNVYVDKLFVSMNSLLYLLQSNMYNFLLHNVVKIYLLNADGILDLLTYTIITNIPLLSKYKRIFKKLYLLHEYGFENDFYAQSGLKVIPIIRGLYFKNFKSYDINTNIYFMFTVLHNTIHTHTEEDIQRAQAYCTENNITYTTSHSINPALEYAGLIYFRYHDYMPRLPYEFWYYNKDVRLVKVSDGLQKRLNKYGERVFDWDLTEVF